MADGVQVPKACLRARRRRPSARNAHADEGRAADLVGGGSAELDVLLVQRNAVEHRLHALTRPAPALMRLDDCARDAQALARRRVFGARQPAVLQASAGAGARTDMVARDCVLEVHVVHDTLLELLNLSHRSGGRLAAGGPKGPLNNFKIPPGGGVVSCSTETKLSCAAAF